MELLEALKTIRKECVEHNRCQYCPLRSKSDDESCGIRDSGYPESWELHGDDVTTPKMFI